MSGAERFQIPTFEEEQLACPLCELDVIPFSSSLHCHKDALPRSCPTQGAFA